MTVPAKASRIWITQLAVGATLGAIAGAVLGGVVFGALGTDSTATSLVRLTPPVELVAIAAGAERTTPDAESYVTQYVAGEVAYLSGVGFTRAVGDSLGRSEPAQIDVLEEIGSSVVVFSASADSDADAVRTVQAAIDVYSDQLEERSEQQLQTILPALDTWQQAANAAGDASRVRQIQTLRESIGLQAGAPAAITVLQQPAVDGASGRQWPLGMVLGALLGAQQFRCGNWHAAARQGASRQPPRSRTWWTACSSPQSIWARRRPCRGRRRRSQSPGRCTASARRPGRRGPSS